MALVLHGAGLDHGDIRLSIGAGALAAAPVLAKALPCIVWAVLLALYAVLAALLGIPYAILHGEDPADYFSRAFGKFANGYLAYSSSVPWIPHGTQDTAAASPPGPHDDTAAASPPGPHDPVRATVPQPAVPGPVFIPRQPGPGPGITAGHLNAVPELDSAPVRVQVPREARRGQRGRHVA